MFLFLSNYELLPLYVVSIKCFVFFLFCVCFPCNQHKLIYLFILNVPSNLFCDGSYEILGICYSYIDHVSFGLWMCN